MKKIACFGELLLRLSPSLGGEWLQTHRLDCYLGGAELNVAMALARWNNAVRYVSAIPENYLSREIIDALKEKNIDCSQFIYGGNRMGQYLLPSGADLKHAAVIYDRANSSFSELKPGSVNWQQIFEGMGWFHFSAISPALNRPVAQLCVEGAAAAAKNQLMVSIDLNYRAKLWQYGEVPPSVMPALVEHCDLVMGNIWSDNSLLGIPLSPNLHTIQSKQAYLEHARRSAGEIMSRFPKCKQVAHTFRFDEGEGIRYFATVDDQTKQTVSREFHVGKVIDRVGSGDCFMAALIHGNHHHWPVQETLDFASAAAVTKFSEKGDATNQTVDAIRQVMLREEE